MSKSNRTFQWLSRIRDVEREHTAVRVATDHLLRSLQDGTKLLEDNLKRLDLNRASANLEATYIIRLFTEFEAGLKRFLRHKRIKVPQNAEPLINRVAARVRIASDLVLKVHRVRDYRNKLVHNLEPGADVLTIRNATRFLCVFFDRLQVAW